MTGAIELSGDHKDDGRNTNILRSGAAGIINIILVVLLIAMALLTVFGPESIENMSTLLFVFLFVPLAVIGMFATIGKLLVSEPGWILDDASLIPVDELPKQQISKGIIVKNFWQSPGTIRYEDETLYFEPIIGKNHELKLADVSSVRFTSGLNGKLRRGMYGVNLRIRNSSGVGFSVKEVEPWRSILTHHVELDSKHNK